MPSEEKAMLLFREKILFGPAKAANAGGVAISGLEMSQNTLRMSWNISELEKHLHDIMMSVHKQCLEYGTLRKNGKVDYVRGANLAGFVRVGKAMTAHGI